MKKLFINFILFFISISIIIFNIVIENKEYSYVYNNYDYLDKLIKEDKVLESFYGVVTAYNPYCIGCIGITKSGYNVKNTICYNDKEYGKIRIIAADKKYKFGSIIRISNNDGLNITSIVLDRGSLIENNKIDLLFSTKDECINFGKKEVLVEVLRYGY